VRLFTRRLHLASALTAGLLALACADRTATAPQAGGTGPFDVVVGVGTPAIHPGDEIRLSVDVTAPASLSVSDARVYLTGLGWDDTLVLPVPGPGSFGYDVSGRIPNGPFAGPLDVTAVARLGTAVDTGRGRVLVSDDGPPQVSWIMFTAGPEPADSMAVSMVVTDVAGIASVTFRVSGAALYQHVVPAPLEDEFGTTWRWMVPATTRLGDSLFVDAVVADAFGFKTTRTLRARLEDRRGPALTVTRSPAVFDAMLPWRAPVYFPGDTMTVTVSAQDHFGVAWLAWRLRSLGIGDSTPGGDTTAALTWRVPVTAALDGPGREVEFVARDSSGNETTRTLTVDFADATVRSFEVLRLGWRDPWSSAVYEPKHGWALIQDGGIRMLSLAPFQHVGTASLTTNSFGLDVLPGGDTAVVGSMQGWALNRVPIGQTPVAITASAPQPVPYQPFGLRATSDGQVVISGATISLGDPGRVVFVDAATWNPTIRTVPGFQRLLTASADRTLLVSYDEQGRVTTYRPATDSFSTVTMLAAGIPSVDAHGTLVLIRNRLYDASLRFLRNVGPPNYDERWSILSADGQYAWFTIWPGLHKVRVSDGVTVERIFTPEVMETLLEAPDRERMLVGGWNSTTLVDLSPGGILRAPAAR
jgi:hypothetical protein